MPKKKRPRKNLPARNRAKTLEITYPYKGPRKQSHEGHRLRRPNSSTGSGEEVRSVKDHSGSYYWHGPRNEVQKETENSQVDRQTGCTTSCAWANIQKMAESKEVAIHCDIG